MELKRGATRTVLLLGRWAIKLPSGHSWRLFLQGLLANMQEAQFSRAGWPEFCPVLFAMPGGFLVVMRRAAPLTDAQWDCLDVGYFCDALGYHVPAENKRDSFGVLAGRVVAVDYGS